MTQMFRARPRCRYPQYRGVFGLRSTCQQCIRLGGLALLASIASRGDMLPVLDDEPGRTRDELAFRPSLFSQPEVWSSASTRHSCFISSIELSDVYSLPAIIQVVRRPRSRSFRRPLAVMPPNGNACSAATASRNGAFGSTLSLVATGHFIQFPSPIF
jgi:hypothetical protein